MKKVKRLLVLAVLGYWLCSCASVFNAPFSDSYQQRIGTYQKIQRSPAEPQQGIMPSPAASIGGNASNADFGMGRKEFYWTTRNFPQ